ncbi:hypothetical protein ASF53_16805 [Methylobacterium sp. Leaf123]|uniref:SAVED domain-containing protein n=1 Tax=Methylobacterium sp. Leaf123 TaxID=1736264 RepID=UPI0006F90D4D|nr:SAVED domain-containing protein [Methylobacterium sp. Leaf123]KQQ11821.1 hypothetical protein ASF53_16805 [Methylobacterium sp. Leaf123]
MTQAVTVRRDGDTFQARMFWRHAARLLDPESPIVRVGFESGPKSFDDMWVEYDLTRSASDSHGNTLRRDHIQCKWHVTPDYYGFRQLIDPEFINANARSLLQRALDAQRAYAPDGNGVRFKLLTNWRLDRSDALREMVSTRSGALRIERLYKTATDNSKAGGIRKAWREHLKISEAELRVLARTLAFGEVTDNLDDLREGLDTLFALVGLRRIRANESAFPYDDLIYQWMGQDSLVFDRESFRAACSREGLLGQGQGRPLIYGVKSFEHAIDRLEDRCTSVLNLVPAFDERSIRCDGDWTGVLYPRLRAFLLKAANGQSALRLALDAHVTLAFAAGSVLNVKSGRRVELEQRTADKRIWSADDLPPDPKWPGLTSEVVDVAPGQPDLAVAVGLTHEVLRDVQRYVERAVPSIGRILAVKPSSGPGWQSVACGRHACELATALAAQIRTERGGAASAMIHLFVAAPNAFTFFLGQRQPLLGRVCLYEFDFEGGRDRSYAPALTLPIPDLRAGA